ncbi:MAG: DUF1735 and LamG domain-containing protein [Tannerella sp.]|jgi:hypothetical protein|nr:DUF1735 and LamG domain-containing protein [Tannerella sp.]
MKTKIFKGMLAVAMLGGFYACDDWNTPKVDYTDNMKVYFVPARNAARTLNLYGICDTTIAIAGARYGGTQTPAGEITATFALGSASLVDAYNTSNDTKYKALPAGVATLLETTATIPANSFASPAFSVRINDNGLLESNESYLLPVQMTNVEGALPINENYTTAYVIVNRRLDTQLLLAELEGHLKGKWTFDDSQLPQKASAGRDMAFGYGSMEGYLGRNDLTYTFTEVTPINGPSAANKAVTKPLGSHLRADHNIGANGGGNRVNEYSILIDFRVNAESYDTWVSLYQTDINNGNEADVWTVQGQFGFNQETRFYDPIDWNTWTGSETYKAGEWHRVIVAVSLADHVCSFYLDGSLANNGRVVSPDAFTVDGFLSLDPVSALIGGDGTDYDNAIDFAEVHIYDFELQADHAEVLGKVK